MRTAIFYSTKHGSSRLTAQRIAEGLAENPTEVFDLKNGFSGNLAGFDRIVIGGSIYAGRVHKRLRDFCSQNEAVLLKKDLGLFICCMYEGEIAARQLREAFPEKLLSHARAAEVLGGELRFGEMNFIERAIIRKVTGISESRSNLDDEALESFLHRLRN